jgi:predicted nucleic-acid-binding protein
MIGLDTNILVRYVMQDDARQSAQATKLIEALTESSPGYITIIVIVELCWVLESAFALSREQIVRVLQNLMLVDVFKIDRVGIIASALREYGGDDATGKAGFADYLIAKMSTQAGCETCMTFDKAAAKSAGMTLVK